MTRKLLFSVTKKDFRVDYFRAGGPGGQKQNKTSSAVRIVHIESGAVGESREERSQAQNKKKAFLRLVESSRFKAWHMRKTAECLMSEAEKREIEKRVDDMMQEENLRIEYFTPETEVASL
jgi:protein subunit release factor B